MVSLYRIDVPEKGQDFANVAKQFTINLFFSKIVTVDVQDLDRFEKTVSVV
ncbi:thermonuclease family protein [Sphingobacterium sp. IITKGP-BTPF85]|uniref:thermonuclease family protein n=1 Tax=Sphingobacterium sp. IITKGP-BTPF85 TaxID=1338009 RepID=UPI0012E05C81